MDDLLGGGFSEGSVVELHGKSGSGKSQVAMQTVLCAAHSGAPALFIDTEGAFRPERLTSMAEARGWDADSLLDKVVYVRTDSSSEQMDIVKRVAKRDETANCKVVAVDTLTRNFTLEMPGRSNAPTRQGTLDLHLSEMARDAFLNSRAYVVTDRVTFGKEGESMIGGQTVRQLVHATIGLEKIGTDVQATMFPGGRRARARLDARGLY